MAPPSLIEQLQPLIERAASGHLDNQEKARLEKMILGYWAQRLQLKETTAKEQLATLLQHPQAGPSIRTLEQWLHSPGSPGGTPCRSLAGDVPEPRGCILLPPHDVVI